MKLKLQEITMSLYYTISYFQRVRLYIENNICVNIHIIYLEFKIWIKSAPVPKLFFQRQKESFGLQRNVVWNQVFSLESALENCIA